MVVVSEQNEQFGPGHSTVVHGADWNSEHSWSSGFFFGRHQANFRLDTPSVNGLSGGTPPTQQSIPVSHTQALRPYSTIAQPGTVSETHPSKFLMPQGPCASYKHGAPEGQLEEILPYISAQTGIMHSKAFNTMARLGEGKLTRRILELRAWASSRNWKTGNSNATGFSSTGMFCTLQTTHKST